MAAELRNVAESHLDPPGSHEEAALGPALLAAAALLRFPGTVSWGCLRGWAKSLCLHGCPGSLTLLSFVCRCTEPSPGRQPIQVRERPPALSTACLPAWRRGPHTVGLLISGASIGRPSCRPLCPRLAALCLLELCSSWRQTLLSAAVAAAQRPLAIRHCHLKMKGRCWLSVCCPDSCHVSPS